MEWNRLNVVPDLQVQASTTDTPSFIQSMKSSPAAYKPMAILVGLMFLQQLSGAYPTISYALSILKSVAADDDKSVGLIGSLEVLGTIRYGNLGLYIIIKKILLLQKSQYIQLSRCFEEMLEIHL